MPKALLFKIQHVTSFSATLAGIMRYLPFLFFILFACGQRTNTVERQESTNDVSSGQQKESCISIDSIGLRNYADFDEMNQSSTGEITFDQLDSSQQNVVRQGVCQLQLEIKNGQFEKMLRFPITGGCLRGMVGIQDYSNNPILQDEIDSLATKTFDNELVNSILNANNGLYVDKETKSINGLTFTITESAGEDEFGEITFSKFYIFQRFKDGFFLTAVLCAG